MPLLYLLYYHKADVTSQTFALCSAKTMFSMMLISLMGALAQDLICSIPPETGYGPEGPTYKLQREYKEKTGRLLPTVIEDGIGDVILSSATVRTESSIMWPKGGCHSKY